MENATKLLALTHVKNFVGENSVQEILVNVQSMESDIMVRTEYIMLLSH